MNKRIKIEDALIDCFQEYLDNEEYKDYYPADFAAYNSIEDPVAGLRLWRTSLEYAIYILKEFKQKETLSLVDEVKLNKFTQWIFEMYKYF